MATESTSSSFAASFSQELQFLATVATTWVAALAITAY